MFSKLSQAVYARLNELSTKELYTVERTGDEVWEAYLAAFPEGTDPIYHVNTEHTCSCCRNFIRNMGNIVAIVDGEVRSIWGVDAPYPYNVVAAKLDEFVRSSPIDTIFRSKFDGFGAEKTREMLEDGNVKVWNHFHGKVYSIHRSATPEAACGYHKITMAVLERGLTEIKLEALTSIEDLIESNSLYRGDEHLQSVREFKRLHMNYHRANAKKNLIVAEYAWQHVARFRNSVIGTLAVDLSNGVNMERAVASFESKVAPTNYKRPKALITKSMIDAALKTIDELGLEPALSRRFANIHDITVNNVLWVNRESASQMKGGIESLLQVTAKKTEPTKFTDVSIDAFMSEVVPTATNMELFVAPQHAGNFVSLTAPTNSDAPKLFKWDNGFGWSYDGNITDSIKERVKRAGGKIDAKIRVSLSWFNFDDLDLHCNSPIGHVYFANKLGILDVDMNAGLGETREPVENMAWTKGLRNGTYEIYVNQFSQRESDNTGFVIEVEANGKMKQFSYDGVVRNNVSVGSFEVRNGEFVNFTPASTMVEGGVSTDKWGITTNQFVKVETLLYSPNHWDGQGVGNRHYIFALKGCINDQPARGIYNEFLRGELDQHRRVFEMLGDKTKCEVVNEQLSGLGFSSTRNDTIIVRVDGRTFNVAF